MTAQEWPCLREGCGRDEDCADIGGGRCGWYGPDEVERDVPDDFADDPAAYEDVEPPPFADPQPVTVGEVDREVVFDPPRSREEIERSAAIFAAARRVHVVPPPAGRVFERLGERFDPRGRHVGCDGVPAALGGMTGGCGAAPGVACTPPRGRFVAGFVHPSRLESERAIFGLTESTESV